MLKLNKYSLVISFLATILTACRGGGGSASSSDGVGNTTATNTAIMVTNNLVGPANQIVAGHTFTITAKLTQGTAILYLLLMASILHQVLFMHQHHVI